MSSDTKYIMIKILLAIFLLISLNSYADNALEETRCCIAPTKTATGENFRRTDVLRAFQKIHPCPSNGNTVGACPNWAKDHVIPLQCGGIDAVSNLQWLPNQIKTASGIYAKDRFERKIYCTPMAIVK